MGSVIVSAFPRDGQRPKIGERLTFETEIDKDGRRRAKNLLCPDRASVRPARQRELHVRPAKHGPLGGIVPLVVLVVALAFYGYGKYTRRATPPMVSAAQSGDQEVSESFRCDGRTHCSEMKSCAEAKFFLGNCPNVEMDGDHDGVPCEQQWCD